MVKGLNSVMIFRTQLYHANFGRLVLEVLTDLGVPWVRSMVPGVTESMKDYVQT